MRTLIVYLRTDSIANNVRKARSRKYQGIHLIIDAMNPTLAKSNPESLWTKKIFSNINHRLIFHFICRILSSTKNHLEVGG